MSRKDPTAYELLERATILPIRILSSAQTEQPDASRAALARQDSNE